MRLWVTATCCLSAIMWNCSRESLIRFTYRAHLENPVQQSPMSSTGSLAPLRASDPRHEDILNLYSRTNVSKSVYDSLRGLSLRIGDTTLELSNRFSLRLGMIDSSQYFLFSPEAVEDYTFSVTFKKAGNKARYTTQEVTRTLTEGHTDSLVFTNVFYEGDHDGDGERDTLTMDIHTINHAILSSMQYQTFWLLITLYVQESDRAGTLQVGDTHYDTEILIDRMVLHFHGE